MTLAILLLPADGAKAQSLEEARAAYADGRFLEAAELADSLGTSDGHALAAESLPIHGYYIAADEDRAALFERAMRSAEEAVRLDAANPEAHFQSAHAMGRDAQIVSVMEALNNGYARKVRAAIEEALRLKPQMAGAHLSLATWNAEVVSKMGRVVANLTFRASRRAAREHYERALELAPDEKVVFLEYANGMMLLGRSRNREQARELLSRAIDLPPKDAYDRILQELAVEQLAALDAE